MSTPEVVRSAASAGVMRSSRRIVRAAAVGGGGIGAAGALGVLGFAVFVSHEISRVRAIVKATPTSPPPVADGDFGAPNEEIRHTIALLGDSTAAGLGVHEPGETPGAQLATAVARLAQGRVRLRVIARPGADSSELGGQTASALEADVPDLTVIMIGANDVKNRLRPAESVRFLGDAVRRLRAAGSEVVVATCPDLGTVEAFSRAGRTLARWWSRRLAAAQTIAVLEAGGRTVSLGDLLGPEFAARPAEMFGADRFHPSPAGYAAACRVIEPAVAEALGYGTAPGAIEVDTSREKVAPRATVLAAATAVGNPGTVVVPDDQPTRGRGWRTWVGRLGRRHRGTPADRPAPADSERSSATSTP